MCKSIKIVVFVAILLVSGLAHASTTKTWTGLSGSTNNWSDAANWDFGTPSPGDDLIVSGATRTSPVNDFTPGTTFNSITFNSGGFTISGASIQLSGGATAIASNAGSNSLGLAITFTAAPTIVASAGTGLTLSGTLDNNTFLISFDSTVPITVSGAISNSGGLDSGGTDVLTLAGANTYSGPTTVSMGILRISHASALGTANGTTVTAGAALELTNNITVATEVLNLNGTGTGTGALSNFSGSNNWNGNINLSTSSAIGGTAGSLVIGSGVFSLTTNALSFFGGCNLTISQVISGSGNVVCSATSGGLFTLSAANTYTGNTIINVGTLIASADVLNGMPSPLGQSTSPISLGSTSFSATLHIIASTISRPINVNGTAGGQATLVTDNPTMNVIGNITMNKPLLIAPNTGSATINGSISTGTSLLSFAVPMIETVTVNGVISGIGGIENLAPGTLVLAGANSYSGPTDIFNGILQLGAPEVIPNLSNVSVGLGTTFDLNSFNETVHTIAGLGNITLGIGTLTVSGTAVSSSFAGVISGSGGLTKNGNSALTLVGNNTYTGPTTVNGGLLAILGLQAGSDVFVNAGATLETAGDTGAVTLAGGAVTVGSPPIITSIVNVTGDFILNAASSLNLNLDAYIVGDSQDQINVSAAFTANGTLNLDLTGLANPGTALNIVTYSSGSGSGPFSSVIPNNNANNYGITLTFNLTALDITFRSPISAPTLDPASDSSTPGDFLTNDNTPTINGTGAAAGSTISILLGGSPLGTTTANGAGNWTFTCPVLADGARSLQASDSQYGGFSSPLSITIDTSAPTPSIGQDPGQSDPSVISPVKFLITFNESVINGFTSSDVQISGTAGATTAVVTPIALQYNVDVTGMTQAGTVLINIPAGAASDSAGNLSAAATISDNSVFFGGPAVINSSLAVTATVGVPFMYSITATNNPTAFSASVNLPPSMLLNTSTGVITGTPTAAEASSVYNVTIMAINQAGSDSKTLAITINAATPPNGAPVAVNDSYNILQGTVLTLGPPGVLFNDSDPDANPITASLLTTTTNGTLVLNSNGGFVYTPNAGYFGPDGFTYRALDASLSSATATVSITVNPAPPAGVAPLITSPLLASGNQNQPFTYAFAASGTIPIVFTASGLPAGLSLTNGLISGTPTVSGVFNVTLMADNGTPPADVQFLVLSISAEPIDINSPLAVQGKVKLAFTYRLESSGAPPFIYSLDSTLLPEGLLFNGATISGVPTTEGVSQFDVTVVDDNGTTASQLLTITILSKDGNAALVIDSVFSDTDIEDVGTPIVFTVDATDPEGDDLTFAWTVISGQIPAVLSAANTDEYTQAFDVPGFYTVQVTVTDAAGNSASASITVQIEAANPAAPVLGSIDVDNAFPNQGATVTFTAVGVTAVNAPLTFTWDFGDGSAIAPASPLSSITHAYAQGGDFKVTLKATDALGVSARPISTLVSVIPLGEVLVTSLVILSQSVIPITDLVKLDLDSTVLMSLNGRFELQFLTVTGATPAERTTRALSAKARETNEFTTDFGVSGQNNVKGTQPTVRYREPGLFVATTHMRDRKTKVETGKARVTLPVSRADVGLPPLITAEPKSRKIGISRMACAFNFSKSGALSARSIVSDKVSVSGSFEMPAGVDMKQPQEVQIAIGNVVETVVLTPKGKGATSRSSLKVSTKSKSKDKVSQPAQMAKFTLKIAAPKLADEGFDTEGVTPNPIGTGIPVQGAMMIAGVTYGVEIPTAYAVKSKGSVGRMKFIKQ